MNESVLDHTAERWKEVDAMTEWNHRREKKIIKFPLNVKHYQNRYTENIEILSIERTKDTHIRAHSPFDFQESNVTKVKWKKNGMGEE